MSYFMPTSDGGADLRRTMDASLLESICSVLEELRPGTRLIPVADGAPLPDARVLDYGAYFDLALPAPEGRSRPASMVNEAADYLTARISRPVAAVPEKTAIPVTTLSSQFYSHSELDRLIHWWDAEPDNAFGLEPVSDQELQIARERIATALDMLRQCAPELNDEILALIRDIVIARPDGVERTSFGASSSFALWGGMVIDYASNESWPQMYRTIVHEAAHNLLFAIARNEPLVENHPDERFPSPVRSDLRPMDGIYHAGFVSARESLALDQLLCWHENTGALSAADAALCLRLLEMSVINFRECTETLHSHGRLSQLGVAILADCEAYMDESFELKPA